jgi:microcin C transport system substrate-binding protein
MKAGPDFRLPRRGFLALGAAAVAAPFMPARLYAEALATGTPLHGISVFGDLKYGPDFTHFDYANPDAPKGGRIVTQSPVRIYNQNFDTFDTLNMYVLRGNGAFGMGLTFASLMTGASDETSSMYGYAAESVTISDDRLTWQFHLHPDAAFHDGSPITAEDVAFSLTTLRDRGHENLASTLREVTAIDVLDGRDISVTLSADAGISTILTLVACPIFSKTWWEGRDFQGSLSEAPLGSGPYRVGRFSFGTFIEFDRVADHWAAKRPVMVGRYNFDRIRYEYYRDRTASFEAFKAGLIQFREEFTSRNWATDYNFPAIADGRVKIEEYPDETPSGGQGWFFNLRRPKFSDRRVREALGMLFDFEWTNANIMYNSFQRSNSFFEKSEGKAEGLPSEAELALLEPFRDQLPATVFGEPFVASASDGSGRDRNRARAALNLLAEAGCKLEGGRLLLPSGEQLTIEFLGNSDTFEPHHNAYIRNLRQIGVQASYRIVDAAQYALRQREFDFDMVVSRFSMSPYPSRFIRMVFGSDGARSPGSYNMAGIANPAIDAILEKLIAAQSQDEFITATRALDRVIRAEHYVVFQWHKPAHWLAYWDFYDRPETKPRYDIGALDTWWTRPDRIGATGMTG